MRSLNKWMALTNTIAVRKLLVYAEFAQDEKGNAIDEVVGWRASAMLGRQNQPVVSCMAETPEAAVAALDRQIRTEAVAVAEAES